jgi:hypothetical protein
LKCAYSTKNDFSVLDDRVSRENEKKQPWWIHQVGAMAAARGGLRSLQRVLSTDKLTCYDHTLALQPTQEPSASPFRLCSLVSFAWHFFLVSSLPLGLWPSARGVCHRQPQLDLAKLLRSSASCRTLKTASGFVCQPLPALHIQLANVCKEHGSQCRAHHVRFFLRCVPHSPSRKLFCALTRPRYPHLRTTNHS